jgi:hypothetical protein
MLLLSKLHVRTAFTTTSTIRRVRVCQGNRQYKKKFYEHCSSNAKHCSFGVYEQCPGFDRFTQTGYERYVVVVGAEPTAFQAREEIHFEATPEYNGVLFVCMVKR